jgi:hypothetical protein
MNFVLIYKHGGTQITKNNAALSLIEFRQEYTGNRYTGFLDLRSLPKF